MVDMSSQKKKVDNMPAEEAYKKQTSSIKSTRNASKVRDVVRTMNSWAQEAKAQGRLVAYCMADFWFYSGPKTMPGAVLHGKAGA